MVGRIRSRWLVAGSLVAGLLAAWPAVLQAQAAPTAYVLTYCEEPELSTLAARVGSAARAALRTTEVRWQSADRAYLGYGELMIERLRRARERLQAGRQAYLDLDYASAVDQLTGAIEDFDGASSAMEDPSELGQAVLLLGASHLFAGRRSVARRIFARLHVQMPDARPDPTVFSPDVVAEFERSAPPRRRDGSITVASQPEGALVYLNRAVRGVTPMRFDSLPPGEHWVRVVWPGSPPFVQQVVLRPGRRVETNALLRENDFATLLDDAAPQLADQQLENVEPSTPLARVGTELGVDRLGVLRVSAGQRADVLSVHLAMYDTETGRLLSRSEGPVPIATGSLETAVQERVHQGLASAAGVSVAVASRDNGRRTTGGGPEVTPPPQSSILDEWWFWTAMSAVVIAGGIVVGVLIADAQEGGNDGGQVILQF